MGKKLIGVNVNITEVNRYDFSVEVDENATKEQQDAEAIAKVKKFLDSHIPSPMVSSPTIDGVKCVDRESGVKSTEIPDVIEINHGF